MNRILLLLLAAILPGSSAILLGHMLAGSALLVCGMVAWNAVPFGFLVWAGPAGTAIGWLGLVLGPLCSAYSVSWTVLRTSEARLQHLCDSADRALKLASLAYLRGHERAADIAVQFGLRCDPYDVELLFFGWQLAKQRGDGSSASQLLKRLKFNDEDGKWLGEIKREDLEKDG